MNTLLEQLDQTGIVVLPDFLKGQTLAAMQTAFASRLKRLRWNDFDGYERTERFRLMVHDVLTLDQGFLSAALDDTVISLLDGYLGDRYRLAEAKGWRSLPTLRMFHGWHADSWYDQTQVRAIPREVKLGIYLTDVKTGAFRYLRGTHRQHHPRDWRYHEIQAFPASSILEVQGPAGTAFLFDTTGIHGQSSPILEPREAVFYAYHDTSLPLQLEDLQYYRYHPLLLNAAFLGDLTSQDQAILGFGDKTSFIPAFERAPKHEAFQSLHAAAFDLKLRLDEFTARVMARLRLLRKSSRR